MIIHLLNCFKCVVVESCLFIGCPRSQANLLLPANQIFTQTSILPASVKGMNLVEIVRRLGTPRKPFDWL